MTRRVVGGARTEAQKLLKENKFVAHKGNENKLKTKTTNSNLIGNKHENKL